MATSSNDPDSPVSKDSVIFHPVKLRQQTARNRIWVPPMCQYVSSEGLPTQWHYQHYGMLSIATGCVIVEATAVSRAGMVTPEDLLLDHPQQVAHFRKLANVIAENGALPGIQLCHGGRKSARSSPWNGNGPLLPESGGWKIYSPSALPFGEGYQLPEELSEDDIKKTIQDFAASAEMAAAAGFKLIEIHAGHGRLVHSFLSRISNTRADSYGAAETENRYLVELSDAVRKAIGSERVLAFRLSCVDYVERGLVIEDAVKHAITLKRHGVDLIDCTSGGIITPIKKRTFPGYQVPYSSLIKELVGIDTGAVGEIGTLKFAEKIIESDQASVVLLGRKALSDPLYLMRNAAAVGRWELVPRPYQRAFKRAKQVQNELIPEL
ncbi:hypothetical protein HFO39_23515 [Rhizobium leguminosarum]|uniref:oxidoreductase n=1 Tax=Rhizobium leguminosarum TaxID=384 RepID=UPI001C96AAA6|nr:hypothetical protein [Rhizobium leguminosarum]MBY5637700.1 hypothetical protein [Rhizobium leguminosarum]